jgi:outer membrane lipoprotein SlyB
MFAAIKHHEHQQATKKAMEANGESPAAIEKALKEGDNNFHKMLGGVFVGGMKGMLTSGGSTISTILGAIFGGAKSSK